MAVEQKGLNHIQIKHTQLAEHEGLSRREFAPNETTRGQSEYLLPSLTEPSFPLWKNITYEAALARFLTTESEVRVLDLGCGAGFWMEEQARTPGVTTFGITAMDYRKRSDRPPVVYKGTYQGAPVYENPDGMVTYIDTDLAKSVEIDNDRYFVGDVHEVLRNLPEGSFHAIVSHQACRYLFDPLRVLKQVHRVLVPGGYAFLESFTAKIYRPDETPASDKTVQQLLGRTGQPVSYGGYTPDGLRNRFGLALKKTRRKLKISAHYRSIEESPVDKTKVTTYYLDR